MERRADVVKLSVCIQAHPARTAMVERLVDRLRQPVPVAYDPGPFDVPSCWRSGRAAWLTRDAEATHHLVLSDDAVPTRNFLPAVTRAIRRHPDRVINWFTIRAHGEEALERGHTWLRMSDWLYGLAISMPAEYIDPMIAWTDEAFPVDGAEQNDDVRIKAWMRHNDLTMWGVVPSLIQHGEPSGSLMGHNNHRRVSRFFPGEDFDALSVDWSKGP